MVSFAASPPNDLATDNDRRRTTRYAVAIDAVLHARGKSQAIVIDDLSLGGAGLACAIGIYANDRVEIELPDGRRLPGTVAWWLSGACGVQFAAPLKPDDPLIKAVSEAP